MLNLTPTHYLSAAAGLALILVGRARAGAKKHRNHPPIIHIPPAEMYSNPREAYETAMREHGPVIAVQRRQNLEFILDEALIPQLFTHPSFSFEEAIATMMNLRPFVTAFWGFFRGIDDLVQVGINSALDSMLERMCPVFVRSAQKALEEKEAIDLFHYTHMSIAEAMMVVIFGETLERTDEKTVKAVTDIATDLAELTGMYLNSSWVAHHFPKVYNILAWIRVTCTSVQRFFRIIGPPVWHRLRSRKWIRNPDDTPTSALEYMAFKHAAADGTIGIPAYLQIMSLLMGVIFASVHQTASVAVWVVFEIALRPEYLAKLRAEAHAQANVDPITHELDPATIAHAVQPSSAPLIDAFIREVMRTKGDTLSLCRRTTADLDIGGCTIPAGNVVFPLATIPHFNERTYPEPTKFRPERWMEGGVQRPAVMTSANYLAFGMGRWACPGRILAVSEIKMIVWSLILKATPRLEGGGYKIVDPLNVTSVPPDGQLILDPL
ncbi:hypothetical protein MKEN_01246600 [Mycena kentingensis (nom. inval.)]|nr:hypothetical protein MKEN_01246600 [Mycena kentingensis (nom. inval.)]